MTGIRTRVCLSAAILILMLCSISTVRADPGRYILIGDSYSARQSGVNPDGSLETHKAAWPDYVIKYLSLKDTICRRCGGYGFVRTGKQFLTTLQSIPASKSVTRIVVAGGVGNDSRYKEGRQGATYSEIREAMVAFDAEAKQKFPNAAILYAAVNWGPASSWQAACLERSEWYNAIAKSLGWVVMERSMVALRFNEAAVRTLFFTDKIHPNPEGQYLLAEAMVKDLCEYEKIPVPKLKRIAPGRYYSNPRTVPASATAAEVPVLCARLASWSKSSLTLTWNAVRGAAAYKIYGFYNNGKAVLLGSTAPEKTSFVKKGLKEGTYYRLCVYAVNTVGTVLVKSQVIYAVTSGGSYKNCRAVYADSVSRTLAVGSSWQPVVKQLYSGTWKKWTGLRYLSDTPSVASVSPSGTIKGLKRGICTVYVIAQDGAWTAIRITVR